MPRRLDHEVAEPLVVGRLERMGLAGEPGELAAVDTRDDVDARHDDLVARRLVNSASPCRARHTSSFHGSTTNPSQPSLLTKKSWSNPLRDEAARAAERSEDALTGTRSRSASLVHGERLLGGRAKVVPTIANLAAAAASM